MKRLFRHLPQILEVQIMAQKVTGLIKLQIPAGKATPAPPVGPALGQHGVNIMAFTKGIQRAHKERRGPYHPCCHHGICGPFVHVCHQDPSGCCPHQEGVRTSRAAPATPNKTKVAKITREQVKKIAEQKMPDLNAASVESAMSMIAGTARSMGIEVVD